MSEQAMGATGGIGYEACRRAVGAWRGEAERLLQRALVLAGAKERATLLQAIGLSRYLENRAEEAIGFFDQAVSAMPNHEQLRLHRALALIGAGRYEQGWAELEWRLACRSFADIPRVRNRPAWDGGDPAGKTILILAEQGLGDTIQFARYGTLLARRGARVVLACQELLVGLMRSMEGLAQVVALGQPLPAFDAYVHCMSLPHRFGTTLETVPAET